jgi:hypothetical protein
VLPRIGTRSVHVFLQTKGVVALSGFLAGHLFLDWHHDLFDLAGVRRALRAGSFGDRDQHDCGLAERKGSYSAEGLWHRAFDAGGVVAPENYLRHANFLGIRFDRIAAEVTLGIMIQLPNSKTVGRAR